jgi:hypothetical protein
VNLVWLFPFASVVLALVVAALATRGIRRCATDLGTEVGRLGEAQERLDGLAAAAGELGDSGHPPPRR